MKVTALVPGADLSKGGVLYLAERSTEDGTARVIEPTRAEVEAGSRKLAACVPTWRTVPALYLRKPDLAAIVRMNDVHEDNFGFQLSILVDQTIVAPPDFDESRGIEQRCVWNQPYLSFDQTVIWAPDCFRLLFGDAGVRRVRAVAEAMRHQGSAPARALTVPMLSDLALAQNETEFQKLLASLTTKSAGP